MFLHTHTFNGSFSGTTQVSRYQKGKTNLDFTEARDSEWQWHQLGHMQVYTSLQTDNHASTPPLSFLQAGCPSCRPTNGVKVLKEMCFFSCAVFRCEFRRHWKRSVEQCKCVKWTPRQRETRERRWWRRLQRHKFYCTSNRNRSSTSN